MQEFLNPIHDACLSSQNLIKLGVFETSGEYISFSMSFITKPANLLVLNEKTSSGECSKIDYSSIKYFGVIHSSITSQAVS